MPAVSFEIIIERCVCIDCEFRDLRRVAQQRGISSYDELSDVTGCGQRCGLCRPYIHAMLRTGQTRFNQLLQD